MAEHTGSVARRVRPVEAAASTAAASPRRWRWQWGRGCDSPRPAATTPGAMEKWFRVEFLPGDSERIQLALPPAPRRQTGISPRCQPHIVGVCRLQRQPSEAFHRQPRSGQPRGLAREGRRKPGRVQCFVTDACPKAERPIESGLPDHAAIATPETQSLNSLEVNSTILISVGIHYGQPQESKRGLQAETNR